MIVLIYRVTDFCCVQRLYKGTASISSHGNLYALMRSNSPNQIVSRVNLKSEMVLENEMRVKLEAELLLGPSSPYRFDCITHERQVIWYRVARMIFPRTDEKT